MDFTRNMTGRECVSIVGGSTHDLHTPMAQSRSKITISVTCSCGKIIAIPNTEETTKALRNVNMLGTHGSSV